MRASLLLCLCLASVALGDIYLHHLRGSNGRLNEDGNNRNNANRLMDTQNNAEGGYCINAEEGTQEYFYEKSLLQIEWTAQHGCGNGRNRCNFVIQYMCADVTDPAVALRDGDGSTTDTIPDDPVEFMKIGPSGRYVYGMHESYAYYQDCKARFRNRGLWIADRNLNGNDARYTRQNNNGDRFGFECTEERDYYPYWAPNPWIDVAVLTDDLGLCPYYKKESGNVKGGGVCFLPGSKEPTKLDGQSCAKIQGASWILQPNGRPAPECLEAPQMRENQLGNAANLNHIVKAANYNWTLPSSKDEPCIKGNCSCVLRIRYNISTDDIVGFGDSFTDYTQNKDNNKKQVGILTNNPTISVEAVNLTLALNTAQHGRTFQDRSHSFRIVQRPSGVSDNARIYNLNVRGKRGNIVQTYPSVEYDFVPNNLEVRKGDYIHFQWMGCDHNPAGNAGEGKDKTDRSNIVQIPNDASSTLKYSQFMNTADAPLFDSPSTRNSFAGLNQVNCDPDTNDQNNDQNCKKLNAAPAYFDGGLFLQNSTGVKYFMSTRNNNFSNRDQKGVITVSNFLPTWGIAVVVVGSVFFAASAAVAGGVFYAKLHPTSQLANVFQNLK
eukprot:TRINITY_DN602_c0_g1_i1.p1 TRINITY_DN602_c0_g1~~TRINITY_DN602_c0_g1_i1.p1  ORF type:complete len:607 (-),score=183.22 TRINITY_DN602_c0_g1_i1:50-1870(-)